MKNLIEWINTELPHSGEWWKCGADEFIKSAQKMLKAGMSEESIKEIFSDLFNAVVDEYE